VYFKIFKRAKGIIYTGTYTPMKISVELQCFSVACLYYSDSVSRSDLFTETGKYIVHQVQGIHIHIKY